MRFTRIADDFLWAALSLLPIPSETFTTDAPVKIVGATAFDGDKGRIHSYFGGFIREGESNHIWRVEVAGTKGCMTFNEKKLKPL